MRILHVITTLDTGGAEHLMVDLLPRLNAMGHEAELLLFNGVETPFKEELKQKGVAIHELSNVQGNAKHSEVYNPMNVMRLRRFLKGYDIIHTHNTACQLYVPLARLFSRSKALLVTTEHNTTNSRRELWWYKPVDRWMYRKYAHIVCIGDKARENLEQYLGDGCRASTIYNGVNTKRFNHQINDISGKDRFVVTMVAAFRPQKDHETILRSFTHLPDNYHLQLVGHGDRIDEMKTLCHELGLDDKVSFLGARMDVPDILEQSDVLVLSSHWEGLSLSSIEGLASGRPFVASDVEGLHEVVGGAGVLFPEGDDKALADAIMTLCGNPEHYRQVAEACQVKAQQFDISVMAGAYMNLYESLMSGTDSKKGTDKQ